MNAQPTAVVIGATGTVGRGIVRQLTAAGWKIVAVARDQGRLDALQRELPGILTVSGSVGSDDNAATLAGRVQAAAPTVNAVIASVNVGASPARLLDLAAERLAAVLQDNLVVHHIAARAFIPLLAAGGRYLGLGGGMADVTFAGVGPMSICQAAQRNMFRFFALETQAQDISVVELMLHSHIVDPADEAQANPREIRADEVGQHVLAVLERPTEFIGPILSLKSRKQIGQPERL
jgi:NAD(P)-dependent dehydrogenase (short-subunit alcohol dehydrogenase family)